jgi:hypothetical protein
MRSALLEPGLSIPLKEVMKIYALINILYASPGEVPCFRLLVYLP